MTRPCTRNHNFPVEEKEVPCRGPLKTIYIFGISQDSTFVFWYTVFELYMMIAFQTLSRLFYIGTSNLAILCLFLLVDVLWCLQYTNCRHVMGVSITWKRFVRVLFNKLFILSAIGSPDSDSWMQIFNGLFLLNITIGKDMCHTAHKFFMATVLLSDRRFYNAALLSIPCIYDVSSSLPYAQTTICFFAFVVHRS